MPLVFIVLGLLFLVVAINGTHRDLWALLKSEFTGTNSFVVWASALVILGLVGYWKKIRPVTDAGIGLIFLVLIIANKGFFAKFNAAIRNPTAPSAPASALTTAPAAPTTGAPGAPSTIQPTPGDTSGAGVIPAL